MESLRSWSTCKYSTWNLGPGKNKIRNLKAFCCFNAVGYTSYTAPISNKLCGRPPQYAPPLQVDNIFLFIRQVAGLFRYVGYLRHHAAASWPLTFWPWKWCPSHVWRGLYTTHVPILVFLGLCSRLRPNVRDRQTDVRCASSLNAPARLLGAGHNNKQFCGQCRSGP